MRRRAGLLALLALSAIPTLAADIARPPRTHETMVLQTPCFSDRRERFYLDLLKAALEAIRQPARIVCQDDLPGRRMWKMMGEDKIDLIWGMQTPDKDKQLVPIEFDLTNGLAGQRVLLIRPENQKDFDGVNSVAALRGKHLVAGFGEGWFDAAVWKANDLPVVELPGQFSLIYPMVAVGNRGIDYLPRGGNEIVAEAAAHRELVIEKHLLFNYNRDMRFYLSPRAARHKAVIEAALKHAETSGLKNRLIKLNFGADLKRLGLAQRRRIELQAPMKEHSN